MNIKTLYRIIRDFLFSSVNKQFLIFTFFLFLSGIFWLIMTLNETYEREVKIPTHIINIPKNVVLTSSINDTIRTTVRDKGWVIMSYLYGDQLKAISIPFKNYDRSNGSGVISSSELKRMIEQEMEISTQVVSVKPDHMEFFYNNGERKRVPVRWTGRVIPDQLYFISQVKYSVDSVEVFASHEKLDSINVIYTEPLNHVNFRDSIKLECSLAHAADVMVVPNHVQVSFFTDVLTEETLYDIPVICLNLPEDKSLRIFEKISVHFVAGVNLVRTLQPKDFVVVADYLEIMHENKEKCNIYLRSVPEGVSRARLSAKEVDYLIEEK